jgi:predicted ATPase
MGRDRVARDPIYQRTFVGRDAEQEQLSFAFDAAMSGKGGVAMVVGEPGIGKTALCEQVARYALQRGGSVLIGHCYEAGSRSLPYLPFVEALRGYVARRDLTALAVEVGTDGGDVVRRSW